MTEPNTTQNPTALPPNKRYILTHDASGKSVIHSSPPQSYRIMGTSPVLAFARSYTTTSFPIDMSNDADIAAYRSTEGPASYQGKDIVVPGGEVQGGGGANCGVIDLAPGAESLMHRTVSVDFSICVNGRIDMELDGGEVVHLNPGDHVVQRGTMHKWINASKTEPARFVAVTLPAVPFEIPGTGEMLREQHLTRNEAKETDGDKP